MKALARRVKKLEDNKEGGKRCHAFKIPYRDKDNLKKKEALLSEYKKTNRVGPNDIIVWGLQYSREDLGIKGNDRIEGN